MRCKSATHRVQQEHHGRCPLTEQHNLLYCSHVGTHRRVVVVHVSATGLCCCPQADIDYGPCFGAEYPDTLGTGDEDADLTGYLGPTSYGACQNPKATYGGQGTCDVSKLYLASQGYPNVDSVGYNRQAESTARQKVASTYQKNLAAVRAYVRKHSHGDPADGHTCSDCCTPTHDYSPSGVRTVHQLDRLASDARSVAPAAAAAGVSS